MTALERDLVRIRGERGALTSEFAQTRGRISETQLQLIQLDQDLRTKVGQELSETWNRVAELVERKVSAQDQLNRVEIRARRTGSSMALRPYRRRCVIAAGETLMRVVPAEDRLTVEARLPPQERDQTHPGQRAILRFSALNQRTTPEIEGSVAMISADVTTDPKTGQVYYTTRVSVPEEQLARLGEVKVSPGMPVEVFVQTQARTVLSYVTKPFRRSDRPGLPGEVTIPFAPGAAPSPEVAAARAAPCHHRRRCPCRWPDRRRSHPPVHPGSRGLPPDFGHRALARIRRDALRSDAPPLTPHSLGVPPPSGTPKHLLHTNDPASASRRERGRMRSFMAIDPNNLAGTASLTFSDEFNGQTLDKAKWGTGYPWGAANGSTNAGNGEAQWYVNADYAPTAGTGTYTVHNGALDIKEAPASAATQSLINGYQYTSGW